MLDVWRRAVAREVLSLLHADQGAAMFASCAPAVPKAC
jgi:hypothetical protein